MALNQIIQREFIAKLKELQGYIDKNTNVVSAFVSDTKAKNKQVVINPAIVQKSIDRFGNGKKYDVSVEIDIYTKTTKNTVVLLDLVDDLVEEMNLQSLVTSNSNIAHSGESRVITLLVEYIR